MVHIVTDTTAGLSAAVVQRYQIPVIPQVVVFGTTSYREGVDLDIPGFLKQLKNARELPKTAAPAPEWFVEVFARLAPTGDPILCIHPSAEVSGTVRSALTAAMEFPGADIRVIDTRLIASPVASLVELAAEWAAAGESADVIEGRLRSFMARGRIYFLVPSLEYLIKGGRIGGASGLIGTVLQIKPILTFSDGHVEPYERVRTHRQALARLRDIVLEQIARNGQGYLTVMHAGVEDAGQALADELRTALALPSVPLHEVPPAVIVHGGPGILGAGFFVGEQRGRNANS